MNQLHTQTNVSSTTPVELSVVVPTLEEAGNVRSVRDTLDRVLCGVGWELIIVDDDSLDGTAAIAKELASDDGRIRCIRRVGRRGLAGAAIEGMLSSSAPFVAVMDGDLQHDPAILRIMLQRLREGECDLAIGTRVGDGGFERDRAAYRAGLSRFGAWLSRSLLHVDAKDPMSGFFAVRREVVEKLAPRLSTEGFKILADIIASSRSRLSIVEIPYAFRERQTGTSKLGAVALFDYAGLVLHHLSGGLLPIRFLLFGIVGASGLLIHLAVLRFCLAFPELRSFTTGELVATVAAMTGNFLFNNSVTFRDRRFTGFAAVLAYLRFAATCSLGIVSNLSIASWIFSEHPIWWLAGLGGALTSAAWNYAVSSMLVWTP